MTRAGNIVALSLLLGCGPLACGTAATAEEIWFGLIAPVSGSLEQYGKGSQNGAELAAKEINAAGGVLGRQLRIKTLNEEDGADAVAQTLIDDEQIVGIVGPIKSSSSQRALPVIRGQIVTISTAATAPGLTDADDDDCFFRAVPSDAFQGQAAAAYVFKELQAKTASLIHNDGPYGMGLAESFADAFEALGGTILADVSYPEQDDYETYDFAPEAQRVFADGPEAVFLVTYHSDGSKFIAAVREDDGYKAVADTVRFMGCDAHTSEFATLADPSVIDGKFFGTLPGPDRNGENYKRFAAAYAAKYALPAGENPIFFSEASYDAVYYMAYAVQQLGRADDRLALRQPLREVTNPPGDEVGTNEWAKGLAALESGKAIDYAGPGGPADLDANGDPGSANFVIYKIEGGAVSNIVDKYEGWQQ